MYLEHQTLGPWDNSPIDPAYYIEDCRISALAKGKEYQKVQLQFWFESDRLLCGSFGVAPRPIHV